VADVAEPIEAFTDEFATDTWHHILINFDGEVGTVFVNGVLENEIDLGVDLGPSGTGMHIGTTQDSTNPFIGLLDEVAIWDRSLSFEVDGSDQVTGGEVATILNSGIHSLGNVDAIGYWPFDDQSDPMVVVDESGNDNTGLLPDVTLGGEIAISAVEPGGELSDGTEAAGRRVMFPIVDTGFDSLTDDGLALFDAAIAWLVGEASGVPGDYNDDGVLDALDIDLQAVEMKKDPADQDLAKFDHNGDGVVDLGIAGPNESNWGDRLIWIRNLRGTSVGDVNFDNVFDSGDLVLALTGAKYGSGEMATWEQGDWNGDMVFDSGDLVLAFQDGQYVAAAVPAAVPEPSSIVLVMLGVTLVLLRRRSA
jgi:hypothetical protein